MPFSTPKIILASSSSYRRQLLQKLQLEFSCVSPDIDESALTDEDAEKLVKRLALQKAEAVAAQHPGEPTLIIGSDQVASLDGTILTKPGNHENAHKQLRSCSARTVTFLTGLCLYNTQTGNHQLSCESFSVHFRELSDEQIRNYLLIDEPYDCAGSFKAEGLGIALFERMEGRDINSLIGLPLIRLSEMLRAESVDVLL